MNLLPETKNIQSKLAKYCRTGVEVDLPGITPNRLHHYRRLVFNIIEEHLESSFPIAFDCIETDSWAEMVNDFFATHDCQSYKVWEIAGEFYGYVLEKKYADKFQLPFLNDLLKFEWEEIRLYNMENINYPSYKIDGNILNEALALNPEHVLFQIEYPIHIQTPNDALLNKGTYFVLLFREKESGKVQFIDVSIWFALLIEQIASNNISLNDLIKEAPKLFGDINIQELTQASLQFLADLKNKDFVLGFKA